jgi:hypothetical protein
VTGQFGLMFARKAFLHWCVCLPSSFVYLSANSRTNPTKPANQAINTVDGLRSQIDMYL